MINEHGEQVVHHHEKYIELHGVDKIVLMTRSNHSKLHLRLRKEGKCNVPPDELQKIAIAAYGRTGKKKEYENKNVANITIDDEIYNTFRKWVSNKNHGRTHGEIKRESEIAIRNHMMNRLR